jgi:hypothetical protein
MSMEEVVGEMELSQGRAVGEVVGEAPCEPVVVEAELAEHVELPQSPRPNRAVELLAWEL